MTHKRALALVLAAILSQSIMTGCGNTGAGNTNANIAATDSSAAHAESDAASSKAEQSASAEPGDSTVGKATVAADTSDSQDEGSKVEGVASADEMTDIVDVVEEGMVPVHADEIENGVYPITVDSSSSMFKITDCTLAVSDDSMSAVMTMSGTGYLYLFMGTGKEAVSANESDYISYEETPDGAYTFTVPVEALDEGIPCAAYSKRKEQWYDRTLLFRADSLPQEALKNSAFTDPADLNLADGTYSAEVTLEGGSGKASVTSPAKVTVKDGNVTAEIIWSSSNYDFMMVNGERFDPVNTDGNSTFEIPVTGFDYKMPVSADTTAMSTPHLIDYTLTFDSSSLTPAA